MAIAPPIDPVCDEDDRPSVLDLIQENRKSIDAVKEELQKDPLYTIEKHDDLWILRFLLSHKKKTKAALKAGIATLKFRKERNLDNADVRQYPVTSKENNSPSTQKYLSYCEENTFAFTVPDRKRGVVSYINFSGINQHKLVETFPEEEWLPAFLYTAEWAFQWIDYITRTTGRLTKQLRLLDLKNFRLSSLNRENVKRDGKAMGITEDAYPQMLESIFVCNAPSWIQIPWRLCRPILPKRTVSKIDFVSPETSEKERKRLLRFIADDNLPIRFGGKNSKWPVPALSS